MTLTRRALTIFFLLAMAGRGSCQSQPIILTNPQSQFLCQGDQLALSVVVTPIGFPIEYEWYRNGILLSQFSGMQSLTLPSVALTDSGFYTVEVGSLFSGYAWSLPARIDIESVSPPVISSIQPAAVLPGWHTFRIYGTGFSQNASVIYGGGCAPTPNPNVTVLSTTEIEVQQVFLKYGDGFYPTVTNPCPLPNGSSASGHGVSPYFPLPRVKSVTPMEQLPGGMRRLMIEFAEATSFTQGPLYQIDARIDGQFVFGASFINGMGSSEMIEVPESMLGQGEHTISFRLDWVATCSSFSGSMESPPFSFSILPATLWLTAPAGSSSLGTAIQSAAGFTNSFTAFSFDSQNAASPSTGPFAGLHIFPPDLFAQATLVAPPWRGPVDSLGNFSWSSPSGFLSGTLPASQIFAVSATWNGTDSQATEVARMAIGSLPAFQSQPALIGPAPSIRHVALTDLNSDGILDLASSSGVRAGIGDGTFSSLLSPATSAHVFYAGDVDNDGHNDLVLSESSSDPSEAPELRVAYGNGTGNFASAPFTILEVGAGEDGKVSVLDLNSDGTKDLIVSSGSKRWVRGISQQGSSPGLYVFLSSASRSYNLSRTINARSQSHAVGDYNGDGIPDLLLDLKAIIWGSPSNILADPITILSSVLLPDSIKGLEAARLDGGARDRAVVVSGAQLGVLRYDMGAWSVSWIGASQPGPFPPTLACVDWDDDGNLDIATGAFINGKGYVQVFENPAPSASSSWRQLLHVISDVAPGYIVAGDLNQNGLPDLIAGGIPGQALVR